jgi:hypothetical protein
LAMIFMVRDASICSGNDNAANLAPGASRGRCPSWCGKNGV